MFKDTKGVSRSHNLKNRQWPNEQKTKELATQAPQKPRVDSATPERLAVPAPLVAPVALLLSKSSGKS
jgi:hypothetical protein